MKRTKIIATLGPSSSSASKIERLFSAGVDVVRLNTKHNEIAWHKDMVTKVRSAATKLHKPVGIMIDLQGPEIRLETFNGEDIVVKRGSEVVLGMTTPSKGQEFKLSHHEALKSLSKGDKLIVDDGGLVLKVVSKTNRFVVAVAKNSFIVSNNKSINFPEKHLKIESLTQRDLDRLDIAKGGEVDFVALSFVRNKQDVMRLREEMASREIDAQIIAKIENRPALDNLEGIIDASDGVMIARGDLGVEVPLHELAFWQKTIIALCRSKKTPVIVATQMLMSMTVKSMPTRAEATDVANAVFDGADCLMLSEETATGNFPVKAVTEMVNIIRFSESKNLVTPIKATIKDATEAIVDSAFTILAKSDLFDIDAVVVFSETGYTARSISAYRPATKVIVMTNSVRTRNTLTLSYGIKPFFLKFPEGEISLSSLPLDEIVAQGIIKKGSSVLAIHGRKWNDPGATSVVGIFKV